MGYAYIAPETVQTSQVTGTLADFPALFSRTSAGGAGVPDFRTVGNGGHVTDANGYDLNLFTTAALTTLLDMEAEAIDSTHTHGYNAATGQVLKWARVSSIAVGTVVYWGYGNAAITTSQDNVAAVWNSAYRCVLHYPDGTTLSTTDSTGIATMTNNGITAGAGKFGGGGVFTNPLWMAKASFSLGGSGAVSVSAWVYRTADTNSMLVCKDPVNSDWELFFEGSLLKVRGGSGASTVSVAAPSINNWHHVAGTITGTTGSLYIDGSPSTSGTVTATAGTTDYLNVGCFGNGSGYFIAATIDEVHVSNSLRSTDWIAAEYNNQFAPTSFWGLGVETATNFARALNVRQAVARVSLF